MYSINIGDAVVVSYNFGMSNTISVEVLLWDTGGSFVGPVQVNIPKTSVSNANDLRTQITSVLTTYLNVNNVSAPANLYYAFDAEIVPASRTSGFATVATSGDYNDLTNKPSIPSVTRTTSTLSLSLVGSGATGTQISSTKDSSVKLNVSTSTTSSIGGPATSLVALKICSTNNATEGSWTTVATLENDQTITLAIALNSIQVMKGQILADVPAGWYVKLVNSGTGTHAEAFLNGQQTIYG